MQNTITTFNRRKKERKKLTSGALAAEVVEDEELESTAAEVDVIMTAEVRK